MQGRPRSLPRCSPGLFLARVLLLSTEIVQQGQLLQSWRRVVRENRSGQFRSAFILLCCLLFALGKSSFARWKYVDFAYFIYYPLFFLNVSVVPGTWGISATVGATCVAPSMSSRADAGHIMMLRGVSCRFCFQSCFN